MSIDEEVFISEATSWDTEEISAQRVTGIQLLEDRLKLQRRLRQATRQENEGKKSGARHKNESNARHPPQNWINPQGPVCPPAKVEHNAAQSQD